jgi:hypothetical protein
MNERYLRLYAEFQPCSGTIGFGLTSRGAIVNGYEVGKLSAPDDLVFRPIENGTYRPPLFSLSREAATELMDHLWHAGIRPTDSHSGDAALDATKAHLADMQKLSNRLIDSLLSPRMVLKDA